MFKLDLEEAEEPEIKLPTSVGSSKRKESSRKISTSASLTTLKSLTVCVSHSVMSNSLWPHGLGLTRLFCPWDSPGKNTGVGCHFLLQEIFPTQGLNLVSSITGRLFSFWARREALWLCGLQKTVENSSRDGTTRPSYLPPEKPVCRSRTNS